MTKITGGCLCGAVRYTADADPSSVTVCHCLDCQKFTGSAFAALLRVSKDALIIEGTVKTFSSRRQRQPAIASLLPGMRLVDCGRVSSTAGYDGADCRDLRRPDDREAGTRNFLRPRLAVAASGQ